MSEPVAARFVRERGLLELNDLSFPDVSSSDKPESTSDESSVIPEDQTSSSSVCELTEGRSSSIGAFRTGLSKRRKRSCSHLLLLQNLNQLSIIVGEEILTSRFPFHLKTAETRCLLR